MPSFQSFPFFLAFVKGTASTGRQAGRVRCHAPKPLLMPKPPEPPFRRTNSVAFALGHDCGLQAFADEKQTSGAAGIERTRMQQGGRLVKAGDVKQLLRAHSWERSDIMVALARCVHVAAWEFPSPMSHKVGAPTLMNCSAGFAEALCICDHGELV